MSCTHTQAQMWVIFTIHQQSYGKVMFSPVFVCLFTGGISSDHYSWLDLTVHPLHGILLYKNPSVLPPLDMGPHYTSTLPGPPLLMAYIGHQWRPIQTCSLQGTPYLHPLVAAIKAHVYSCPKWALCILLECFLVKIILTTARCFHVSMTYKFEKFANSK